MIGASVEWVNCLNEILLDGEEVSPRGKDTLEILHDRISFSMLWPVVDIPERALNYRFMAAEAYAILTGSNRVDDLAPYNPNIAQFSDDEVTFAGAYGPPVMEQLPYVADKLTEDPSSRQAGLTIWKPSPAPSKDIPCTIALWWMLRHSRLDCHVFMRSNDAWLGMPYDVFNASMISCYLCGLLAARGVYVNLGDLYHTAVSRHLYQIHWEAATGITEAYDGHMFECHVDDMVPAALRTDTSTLLETLKSLRDDGTKTNSLAWWRT